MLSYFWGAEIVQSQVYDEISSTMGQATADSVEAIFANASEGKGSWMAASSVIIILCWISYSLLILFSGAEFTWVFTRRYGYKMTPKSHARFMNKAKLEE
jgi:hypothetical protein